MLAQGLGHALGDFRQHLDHHLGHGGIVVLLVGFGFLLHSFGFGQALLADGLGFGLTDQFDAFGLLLLGKLLRPRQRARPRTSGLRLLSGGGTARHRPALRTSASSLRCCTSASWAARSTIFFCLAISASASDSLTSLARRFVWIMTGGVGVGSGLVGLGLQLGLGQLQLVVALCDGSLGFDLPFRWLPWRRQPSRRRHRARLRHWAMEARFFTSSSCSTPMASMTPWLWPWASMASLTSCTLKVTTSRPILARSGRAFSTTLTAICLRLVKIWSTGHLADDLTQVALQHVVDLLVDVGLVHAQESWRYAACWRLLMYFLMSSVPGVDGLPRPRRWSSRCRPAR